jgi:hypothetical protein
VSSVRIDCAWKARLWHSTPSPGITEDRITLPRRTGPAPSAGQAIPLTPGEGLESVKARSLRTESAYLTATFSARGTVHVSNAVRSGA